jgi:predicted RNA-binding Zn-ribbon protein involved in translation (DUF1610 family)
MKKVSLTCSQCNSELRERFLSEKEIEEKLERSDYTYSILTQKLVTKAVYYGYVYFECPKCGWFKFVKRRDLVNEME